MAIVVAVVLLLVLVEGIFIITPSPAHTHTHTHRSRVRDVQHIFSDCWKILNIFSTAARKAAPPPKTPRRNPTRLVMKAADDAVHVDACK